MASLRRPDSVIALPGICFRPHASQHEDAGMPKTRRIIVVGAGLGGLAATVGLRRKGFEVEVYEQSPVLGEIGAGINITPNGAEGAERLRPRRRSAPARQHRHRADDVRHEDRRAAVRLCLERVRGALRPAAVSIPPRRPARPAAARGAGIHHPSRRALCRRLDHRHIRRDHPGKRPADRSRRGDRRRRHPLADSRRPVGRRKSGVHRANRLAGAAEGQRPAGRCSRRVRRARLDGAGSLLRQLLFARPRADQCGAARQERRLGRGILDRAGRPGLRACRNSRRSPATG